MRLVTLCDINGEDLPEKAEVSLGFKYELLFPVVVKDRDGNTRDTVDTITFDRMPNRKTQKEWARIKDNEDRQDKMTKDMTGLTSAQIDELILHDTANIGEILLAFLPKSMIPKEIES